jgi:hypothetical protein
VLAEGRQFGGRREVVGMKSRLGACLSFERTAVLVPFYGYPCDERATPRPKRPLRVELVSSQTTKQPDNADLGARKTEIGGVLRPDVARVEAVYIRAGEKLRQDAITGQVDRDLARRVGFGGAVGVFDLGLRGNPLSRRNGIRLKAFDDEGSLLRVDTLSP